jgi:hypothetical protein
MRLHAGGPGRPRSVSHTPDYTASLARTEKVGLRLQLERFMLALVYRNPR